MTGRVLITGGLGFLGGRISEFLLEQELDSLIIVTRKTHVSNILDSNVEVREIDWGSQKQLEGACKGVDTIIHLAAMNAGDCLKSPLDAWNVNVINTAALMEAAKHSNVKRVIYFSTAHVYGANLTGNVTEETLPRALNIYAATHRAAEDIVLGGAADNLVGVVLRLSNGIGRSTHYEVNAWMLLVNDICMQAASTGRIVLNSDGLQFRNFITLEDVARVTSHFLSLPKAAIGAGLFNVGSRESKRVVDMARLVRDRCRLVLGHSPEIICMPHGASSLDLELNYCIDRLLETGFSLRNNFENEIDGILLMCSRSH